MVTTMGRLALCIVVGLLLAVATTYWPMGGSRSATDSMWGEIGVTSRFPSWHSSALDLV